MSRITVSRITVSRITVADNEDIALQRKSVDIPQSFTLRPIVLDPQWRKGINDLVFFEWMDSVSVATDFPIIIIEEV